MNKLQTILAIDTSCDDTSIAITSGVVSLVNLVVSQTELHKPYGGVFPTIAKEAHKKEISQVTKRALSRTGLTWEEIDAVAVTAGPGLAPALEVGINWAKELAEKYQKPLIAVNHIEGHLLSGLVTRKSKDQSLATQIKQLDQDLNKIRCPVLGVIVSGGHSEFILVKGFGKYQRLGWKIDDAAGEALDKVGRMLNLGYPAGSTIEEFAKKGNPNKYEFPLPMTTSRDYNLSFSGLKTYARNLITKLESEGKFKQQDVYDFCASFQKAVFRHLTYKLEKILDDYPDINQIWLGGGVAANLKLKTEIRKILKKAKNKNLVLKHPYSKKLCADNAAMIGVTAYLAQQKTNFSPSDPKTLDRLPKWKIV